MMLVFLRACLVKNVHFNSATASKSVYKGLTIIFHSKIRSQAMKGASASLACPIPGFTSKDTNVEACDVIALLSVIMISFQI
uniref:Uncharacterized protein n=1 Tax=Romanomermis culicivorax TaxID=13658 RepID=A0A915IZD8_ROMCU